MNLAQAAALKLPVSRVVKLKRISGTRETYRLTTPAGDALGTVEAPGVQYGAEACADLAPCYITDRSGYRWCVWPNGGMTHPARVDFPKGGSE